MLLCLGVGFGPLGCGVGTQETGGIPSFMETGKSYTFGIAMAGRSRLKVLEIDRKSGWIKVEGQGVPTNTWLNLAHVLMITP